MLLEIAGIRFRIQAPAGMDVVEDDPRYAPFLRSAGTSGRLSCRVRLEVGRATDTEALPLLFETGNAWTAHRDGRDHVFTLSVDGGPPLWQARLSPDGQTAIRCSEHLVDRRGPRPRVSNPVRNPLDQLLVTNLLATLGDGLLVHGAAARTTRGALLFPGRSGAGKTTLCRLLEGAPDLEALSDERVAVRRVGASRYVYGTPWPGEAGIVRNVRARLRAIVFLRKADANGLAPLPASEAVAELLPTLSLVWHDAFRLGRGLAFAGELVEQVPAYRLSFRPEPAAVDALAPLLRPVRVRGRG